MNMMVQVPKAELREDARRATASPNQVLAIVCVGICLANLDLSVLKHPHHATHRELVGLRFRDDDR